MDNTSCINIMDMDKCKNNGKKISAKKVEFRKNSKLIFNQDKLPYLSLNYLF